MHSKNKKNYNHLKGSVNINGREVSRTQTQVWNTIKTSQRQKEMEIVLRTLQEFGPLTSRALVSATEIERTNIRRVIDDLLKEDILYVCKIDVCPATGMRIESYWFQQGKKDINYSDLHD